jgi:outer membrane protein OmpA-like peptidoglycan-associated protein
MAASRAVEDFMRLRTALSASAAAIALTATAHGGELRGTYFAIEGGASWVGDNSILQETAVTGVVTTGAAFAAQFETGWAIMGTLGYAFDNNLRAELEAGYRRNDFDRLTQFLPTITGASAAGDLSEFTLMANLLYDFRLGDKLTLSIGGGIGADHARLKVGQLGFSGNEWVLAYQGIAGLSYAIGERTQLFVNYRYLHADAPEYTAALGANTVQHTALLSDLGKHSATLGIRFALEEKAPAPEPMAPPPAPPPPPPPAPMPPTFIVFFGYNSATLVPEAERVVSDAASAVKDFGAAAITIVGHTDSSGSDNQNQRLSERRAEAVRAALVRQGVPAETITASGKGEGELMVRTGDGVKEPQNRRATIDLR